MRDNCLDQFLCRCKKPAIQNWKIWMIQILRIYAIAFKYLCILHIHIGKSSFQLIFRLVNKQSINFCWQICMSHDFTPKEFPNNFQSSVIPPNVYSGRPQKPRPAEFMSDVFGEESGITIRKSRLCTDKSHIAAGLNLTFPFWNSENGLQFLTKITIGFITQGSMDVFKMRIDWNPHTLGDAMLSLISHFHVKIITHFDA